MKTPFFAAMLAIFRKDTLAESRSRELIGAMGLFALLDVLIFSFALELNREARIESVSGVLWVTIVFASILGLNRSMAMERDQGNLDVLLLAPLPRSAIFAGKLLGNFLFTALVGLAVAFVITILFNVPLFNGWMLIALLLGTAGFTIIGTLLAAMTAQTRARETLLPIVMLPVAVPLLLAAVRGTTYILNGAAQDEWLPWLSILTVLNIIFLVLGVVLFEFVVEE
ncbi:MAG: heme exporter protein CcmB [Chloroflexi bacterium OLB15]|nr:MAG: heme exporter protein CcmB [Chloroflexi bacterium OLB15]